jgi:hypothetical protein
MEGTNNNSARRQHQKPLNAGLTRVVGWTPIVTAKAATNEQPRKKTHNLIQNIRISMRRYTHTESAESIFMVIASAAEL